MTAPLTLTRPMRPFDLAARLFRRRPARLAKTQGDAEQSRRRRDFILDRLNDNPDAFASEYDVQAMMTLYPRDF